MSAAPFDVVFLDAGGVLVSPHPDHIVARFAAAGHDVDPARLFEAHYRGVAAIDDAQADPEVFTDYHRAYATHLGLVDQGAEEAVGLLQDLWATTHLWTNPLPWAVAGLRAIAETGVAIVIVSNADGTVAEMLAHAGLLQVGAGAGVQVAAIIDSGAVGVAKPDPAIFTLALEAAGTTADRAIHVGDAYQYDVRGARAAGVRPVLVDPLDIRTDADCDRIASLVDLVPMLR